MTATELRVAINTGKEIIQEYRNNNQQPPEQVYIRMMELYEELIEALTIGE